MTDKKDLFDEKRWPRLYCRLDSLDEQTLAELRQEKRYPLDPKYCVPPADTGKRYTQTFKVIRLPALRSLIEESNKDKK